MRRPALAPVDQRGTSQQSRLSRRVERAQGSAKVRSPSCFAGLMKSEKKISDSVVRSRAVSAIRLALIDDDYWTRSAMVAALEPLPEIDVVLATGQDEALTLAPEAWSDVQLALVDVLDITATLEVGTDLFSGISALERLRDLGVRAIAIAPHEKSVLLAERIFESAPLCVYLRHELGTPDALVRAVCCPDLSKRPVRPTPSQLFEVGAERARANEAVHVYERSPVHGWLHPGLKLRQRRFSRRQLDALSHQVQETGFDGSDGRSARARRAARWPETRRYLLRLLGRED